MNSIELFEDTIMALRQLRVAFLKQGLEPPSALEFDKRAAAALKYSAEEATGGIASRLGAMKQIMGMNILIKGG